MRAISKFWTFLDYASFGTFHSNSRNIEKFDMTLIFILRHHTSFYISLNSRKTLGSYRKKTFPPCFSHFSYFFHSFHGISLILRKSRKKGVKIEKRLHPITIRCITGIDKEGFSASRMSEDEFELKQPRMSESEWVQILLNREQIWFLNVLFSYSQLCWFDENIFEAL